MRYSKCKIYYLHRTQKKFRGLIVLKTQSLWNVPAASVARSRGPSGPLFVRLQGKQPSGLLCRGGAGLAAAHSPLGTASRFQHVSSCSFCITRAKTLRSAKLLGSCPSTRPEILTRSLSRQMPDVTALRGHGKKTRGVAPGALCSRCDLARGEACSPRGHAPAAPAMAFTPKWRLGPRPDRAPACAISPSLSPTDGRGSREHRSLRSFLVLAVLAPFTKGRNSRSLNVADPGKRACLRGALRGRRPRPARSFLSGNRRPCRRSTLLGTDRILRLKMTRFSKTARNELKRSRHVFSLSRFH